MNTKSTKPGKYQYEHLPHKRCFRLLRVVDGNHDIELQMSTHDLDAPPNFEALSYTWGKATRPLRSEEAKEAEPLYPPATDVDGLRHTVYIDGGAIQVTENLYDVLFELRRTRYMSLIWVDALCIDQGHMPERQSQVSQMGDLYATASCVVIWLGKDETYLEEFIWLHEMLPVWIEKPNGVVRPPRDPELLAELNLTLTEWERRWICYGRFYNSRRWFARAWVMQELALARETRVLCGQYTLNMDAMIALSLFIRELSNWSRELWELAERPESLADIQAFLICLNLVQEGGPNAAYFHKYQEEHRWLEFCRKVILSVREKETGVFHDKIYGGLGICNRYLPKNMPSPIEPDYSLSATEVFTQFTALLLTNLPHLKILSHVEDRSVRISDALPSWCPDFKWNSTQTPLSAFCKSWKFSGDLTSDCQISANVLRLRGAHVDTIDIVSRRLDGGPTEDPLTKLNILLGFVQLLDTIYIPTGQDRLEVLWRTIIVDSIESARRKQDEPDHPAPSEEAENFMSWILYWYSTVIFRINRSGLSDSDPRGRAGFLEFVRKRNEIFKESSVPMPTFEMAEVEALQRTVPDGAININTVPMPQAASVYHARISRILTLRKLLKTRQGHFGLAKASVEKDDEIWMLHGANLPMILRPVGENYIFMGDAYLHGFMDGEALESPDISEQTTWVSII